MDNDEWPRLAIKKWGKTHQLNKAKEELAELIVAISHWEQGRMTREAILSEIVDVCIMTAQVSEIVFPIDGEEYFNELFDEEMERKLKRLERRIKDE